MGPFIGTFPTMLEAKDRWSNPEPGSGAKDDIVSTPIARPAARETDSVACLAMVDGNGY